LLHIKYLSLFLKFILNNNAFSKLQSLILDRFLVNISPATMNKRSTEALESKVVLYFKKINLITGMFLK
jgi:hypothetical protein